MTDKLAIPDMASTPTPATPGTARSTAPLMGKDQGVDVAESRCQWAMSRFIVARPLTVFFGTSFIILVLSAIVGATGLMTFSEPSQHDWTIADAIESERLDAWTNAVSQTDNAGGTTEVDPRSESTQSLFLRGCRTPAPLFRPRAVVTEPCSRPQLPPGRTAAMSTS